MTNYQRIFLSLTLTILLTSTKCFAVNVCERFPSGTPLNCISPSGTLINGNCAQFDASGNIVDSGTTCGGSSSNILPNANGALPTISGEAKFDYTTHLLYIGTGSTSVQYVPVASVANGGECTYSNAEGGRIYCNTASLTTIPGGSIYDIQINDGFSQFYGEDSFNYNPGTDVLTIGEIGTAGTINLEYSNSDTLTLKSAALSTNRTFTFPDTTGTGITTGDIQTVTNTMISGPITLAKGGTNQVLSDPNTDGIFFWDDSYGGVRFLDVGTGLLITGTTIKATGSGGITDYVASVGTSIVTGLTGGAAGSAGAALNLAFDYSATLGGDPALAPDQVIFGSLGLIFEGHTADSKEYLLRTTTADNAGDVTLFLPDEGTFGFSGSTTLMPNYLPTNDIWVGSGGNNATAVSVGGDLTMSGGNFTVASNAVALGADTTGDYVASVGTSILTGLTGGTAGSETAALNLAFDYSSTLASSPAIAAGHMIFAASGIIAEGATADGNEMLLTVGDPTSDVTVTIPARTGSLVGDADVKKLPGQALNVTLPAQTFFLKIGSTGTLTTAAGVSGTNVGDVQYRASSNTFGGDAKFNYTSATGTLFLKTPDDTSDLLDFEDSSGNIIAYVSGTGNFHPTGITLGQGGGINFGWSVGGSSDSLFTTDSANTFYIGGATDQFGGSTGNKFCIRAGLGNTCMETADGTTEGILVQGTGGLTITSGKIRSNSTTGVGWSRQSAANQACNTTCPRGCAFGFDQGTLGVVLGSIVSCSDASADQCICM